MTGNMIFPRQQRAVYRLEKAVSAGNFMPCWISNLCSRCLLKRCDRHMVGGNNGTIKLLLVCLSLGTDICKVVFLHLRRQMLAGVRTRG